MFVEDFADPVFSEAGFDLDLPGVFVFSEIGFEFVFSAFSAFLYDSER